MTVRRRDPSLTEGLSPPDLDTDRLTVIWEKAPSEPPNHSFNWPPMCEFDRLRCIGSEFEKMDIH